MKLKRILTGILILSGTACSNVSQDQSTNSLILEEGNEVFVNLEIDSGLDLTGFNGKAVIEFHSSSDFQGAAAIVHASNAASLGVGNATNAEYALNGLAPGKYFVRAFLDADRNGELNAGEARGIYEKEGEAARIQIKETGRQLINLAIQP